SGLVLGVVGIVGALAAQPSGYDQLEADARRKLFLPKEDDLVAIERGADGANAAVRTRCGGRPAPFRPPRLPPPSPAPAGPAEEMTVPSAPPATSVRTRPAS
ncbi:MAG TPA: hypothetical protein VHE30_14015, partial [Polyangiaceae bacterium]|nr:hypothetical protein [Polyangiaceae bacterium]